MALYLISSLIFKKNYNFIVGELTYKVTHTIINNLGGHLIKTPINKYDLDIDFIEDICN